MASKVNVKFVVILSAALVVLALGAGGAYMFVKYRSGEHWVSKGDEAMAQGKFDQADGWYARAVGKEQRNVEWLTKWRAAREKKVPASENVYVQDYQMYSQGILRNLALAQNNKVGPVVEYLDNFYQEALLTTAKGAWEALATQTDELMRGFEPNQPPEVRRYRALALSAVTMIDPATTAEKFAKARAELEAVLKDNPKDSAIAVELSVWFRGAAERAKAAGDSVTAKSNNDRAREVVAQLLTQSPNDPTGLLSLLTLDASNVEWIEAPGKAGAELIKIKQAALDALQPRVKELCDKLLTVDPKTKLPVSFMPRLIILCPRIDPKDGNTLALGVIDHFLKGNPDSVDLLLSRSQIIALSGKPEEMIKEFQKLVDMPNKPVSLEGIRLLSIRNRARFAQANASLQLLLDVKDDATRNAALERAKTYRTQLANFVPENAPELQFVDAKMALFRNDTPRARQLLAEFLKKPGDVGESTVLEANLLMADIGLKSNPPEPGLARECLLRVLRSRPSSVEVRLMLGSVEKGLQAYDAALQTYQVALDIDPDNKIALEEVKLLRSLKGEAKLDDPVTQLIVDAQRLARGTREKLGDEAAAMKLLESNLEKYNYEPRLVFVISNAKVAANDKAGAEQLVKIGLQKNPDNAQLKDYALRLNAANSLEGVVDFIKKSQMSDLEKQMSLFKAYADFGKKDEAAAALNEAAKLAPDDARVIEYQFQRALVTNDAAETAKLVERAAKADADKAGGDTYRARLLIAQKNYRDATTTLARAIDRGNANAAVYRLMGLVQAEIGRIPDAMGSFRRAIDLAPTDLVTIKTYLNVLVKAGDINEAVAVARRAEGFGRADAEFLEAWLALEAQSGKPEFALARRQQIFDRNPKDASNALALASLYLDSKRWDDSKKIIEQLKAENPGLRVVMLEARFHADQGNLNAAKAVFTSHIGSIPQEQNEARLEAYTAFGQFLWQRGLAGDAMAAYRQAIRFQKPGSMDIELIVGDLQLNAAMFDDAEKTYRKVYDAKIPDPDRRIIKRMIEAMNQQQKFAEVEGLFKSIGNAADEDVEMMAQRASAVRGLGDIEGARKILDRAIQKFPDEPLCYLRRARLLAMNPAYTQDAMSDLSTAIKLRPGFWQALRTRAMVNFSLTKTDEALRDLAEAVERNPGMDELRLEYIEYLVRFGKESEAVDVADAALRTRPNDLRFVGECAQVFARAGRWARSARFYKLAWEQLQNEDSAGRYANAMLAISPPPSDEIESLLSNAKLKVDRSWNLLLVRAALKKKQGKGEAARADVAAAYDIASSEVNSLMNWMQSVRQIFTDPNEALAVLNAARAPAKMQEWMTLAQCIVAADEPKGIPEALTIMRALRDQTADRTLKVQIQTTLCDILARTEKWEEAVKEIEIGLQLTPDSAVLANNAAAIMSEKLNRPKDALPFAERARAANPKVWQFTDTLASAYMGMGDKAQAVRYLQLALTQTSSEADKAKLTLKLARWKFDAGDQRGAEAALDALRELMADSPTLADVMKTEFKEVDALVKKGK